MSSYSVWCAIRIIDIFLYSKTTWQLTSQIFEFLQDVAFGDINKQGTVASVFARCELLQFFLWGMLKDEVYSNAPQAEDDLQMKVFITLTKLMC